MKRHKSGRKMMEGFIRTIKKLDKNTRGIFDELDKRRKKGELRVTISHALWSSMPKRTKETFIPLFMVYLIVKYPHHKAIDKRSYAFVGDDEHGKIFRLRNDAGRGWFNNGVA